MDRCCRPKTQESGDSGDVGRGRLTEEPRFDTPPIQCILSISGLVRANEVTCMACTTGAPRPRDGRTQIERKWGQTKNQHQHKMRKEIMGTRPAVPQNKPPTGFLISATRGNRAARNRNTKRKKRPTKGAKNAETERQADPASRFVHADKHTKDEQDGGRLHDRWYYYRRPHGITTSAVFTTWSSFDQMVEKPTLNSSLRQPSLFREKPQAVGVKLSPNISAFFKK